MRYHQGLQAKLKEFAEVVLDMTPEARANLRNYMRGRLIADYPKAVLPEPIPFRVLGRESPKHFWRDIGLRDTIERAWHREDKYFGRQIKEG